MPRILSTPKATPSNDAPDPQTDPYANDEDMTFERFDNCKLQDLCDSLIAYGVVRGAKREWGAEFSDQSGLCRGCSYYEPFEDPKGF